MGLLRYYWQVIRVAFTRAPGIAQDILFGLFVFGGAVLYFLKRMGMITDASGWLADLTGWQISTIVLATIFAVRLLLAPYWMYEKKSREVLAAKLRTGLDKPDLNKWLELDPLELGQVAFLWCDREPDGSAVEAVGEVNFAYEKLKRAVLNRQLKPFLKGIEATLFDMQISGFPNATPLATNPIGETLRVSVSELRRYAEAAGEKPKFLFPAAVVPHKDKTDSTVRLAGLVRLISERAGRYGFTFTANDDAFFTNYKALEESADPIWIDPKNNQLRRDFLQYCAALGDANEHREFDEGKKLRSELFRLRDVLMAELTGKPTTSVPSPQSPQGTGSEIPP
jgi:hypothetical protein